MAYFTKSPFINEDLIFNAKRIIENDNKIKHKWARIIIDGVETDYDISTYGEVRNHITMEPVTQLDVIPSGNKSHRHYVKVILNVNGEQKHMFVHRLVAIAFIPIPKKYLKLNLGFKDLEVNHMDLHNWHNVINNLKWTTRKENIKHAKGNTVSNSITGERNHMATITDETAHKICKMLSEGVSVKKIAEKHNVTPKLVQHIKSRECWTEVSKDYKFVVKEGKYRTPGTINDELIHDICKFIEQKHLGQTNMTDREAAKKYGIDRSYIGRIRRKLVKQHISQYYNF